MRWVYLYDWMVRVRGLRLLYTVCYSEIFRDVYNEYNMLLHTCTDSLTTASILLLAKQVAEVCMYCFGLKSPGCLTGAMPDLDGRGLKYSD